MFQAERWNSTTSVTLQQREKNSCRCWKTGGDVRWWCRKPRLYICNAWWIWNHLSGKDVSTHWIQTASPWQSGKIPNLDSLPIWIRPRVKQQNFWGDPAAQGKPQCMEPQSRMDLAVLEHQNLKLMEIVMPISPVDGNRIAILELRTLLDRWWVASWPKPWGERIGGITGWKSLPNGRYGRYRRSQPVEMIMTRFHKWRCGGTVPYKAMFWLLCRDNRPHQTVSYGDPMKKTTCSKVGLCRAHVGSMLSPCCLCVGPCGARVGPMCPSLRSFWNRGKNNESSKNRPSKLQLNSYCNCFWTMHADKKTPLHLQCGRILWGCSLT